MPEKLPNVSFGIHKNKSIALKIHKKQVSITLRHRKKHFDYSQRRSSVIATKSSRNLALENGSESLKQQQDSCQRLAKHKPEKLLKRRLRNPLKGKKKDGLQAGKPLLESFRERLELWPWDIALPKPRTAAGSVPKACKTQARQTLETSLTGGAFAGLVPRSSRNLALEYRLRKPRTAAGFVP